MGGILSCCCPPGGEPEVETPTTLLLEPRAIDHGTTELRDPSPTAAGLPRASSSSSHDPMPSHHLVRGLAASDESGGMARRQSASLSSTRLVVAPSISATADLADSSDGTLLPLALVASTQAVTDVPRDEVENAKAEARPNVDASPIVGSLEVRASHPVAPLLARSSLVIRCVPCARAPNASLPISLTRARVLPHTSCRVQYYNSLIGAKADDAPPDTDASDYKGELNTETCVICTSEIILGPQEAIRALRVPPGEAPRHFECGHALHSDCFAVYICSARSGHACPICALDRDSAERDSRTLEESDGGDEYDEEGEEPPEDDGRRLPHGTRGAQPQLTPASASRGEFTELTVLDALAAASPRQRGGRGPPPATTEDNDDDDEALDPEEELALQQALQLSIRGAHS